MRPHNGLNIQRKLFKELDITQPFFDVFRFRYPEFDEWASRKANDEVYVVERDGVVVGFLKLKIEDETEDYSDIVPAFRPGKRIKICSLRSCIHGIGSRFMDIIQCVSLDTGIDSIYATVNNPDDDTKLFFLKHGFVEHGKKITNNLTETVYRYEHNYLTH